MKRSQFYRILTVVGLTVVGTGGLMAAVFSDHATSYLGRAIDRVVLINGSPTRMQVSTLQGQSVDPDILLGQDSTPGYSPVYAHAGNWVAKVQFPDFTSTDSQTDDESRRVKISLLTSQDGQAQDAIQFDVPFTSATESVSDSRSLIELPDYLKVDEDAMVYSVSNETEAGMSDMWVFDSSLGLLSRVRQLRSRMESYGYELISEQADNTEVLHSYSQGVSYVTVYSSSGETSGTRDVIHAQLEG